MDAGILVGGLAAILTGIAGVLGGIATNKSSRVNATTVAIDAMNTHMTTLSGENASLRERVDTLDKEVRAARAETARCEADKESLKRLVLDLQKEVRGV